MATYGTLSISDATPGETNYSTPVDVSGVAGFTVHTIWSGTNINGRIALQGTVNSDPAIDAGYELIPDTLLNILAPGAFMFEVKNQSYLYFRVMVMSNIGTIATTTAYNTKVDSSSSGVTGSGVAGQVSYWNGANALTGNAGLTYTPNTLYVGDGVGSSGNFMLNAPTSNQSSIHFMTTGIVRWDLFKGGAAETGADAGSNLGLAAYSDAGTIIDTPIAIGRALAGVVAFSRSITAHNNASAFSLSLGANTTPGSSININSAAANTRLINCQTAGVLRWSFGANATAEGGENAGSDFAFNAYSDAGALLDSPLTIARVLGGAFTVNRPASFSYDSGSYTMTVGASANTSTFLTMNSATGSSRKIQFQTATSARWATGASSTAESGSNAGTNYVFDAYDDSGVLIDSPLTITRAAAGNILWASGRNMGIGLAPTSKLHLDSGTATASYCKFTAGTTTGTTSSDGFDLGVDVSGNAVINQREALPIIISTTNVERMRLGATSINTITNVDSASSGVVTLNTITSTLTQTGTAAYTIFKINANETTTGSGPKNLQDWQTNGLSVAAISNAGTLNASGGLRSTNLLTLAHDSTLQLQLGRNYTSGTASQAALSIGPTIIQSGTAGYTILLINSIETSIGSGIKALQDWQVGGVSKMYVDNAGGIYQTGQAAQTHSVLRHTTANTAGNSLSVNAGGATSAATDKAGGTVSIAPGVSTGTGISYAAVKRYDRAASTGTSDNATYEAVIVCSPKTLTNTSAIGLFDVAMPAGSSCGGTMSYTVECTNGTDYQTRAGVVVWTSTNKAGVYVSSIASTGEQVAVSTGTLTNAWTVVSGTNKVTITLASTSSLTPTVLKVWMKIDNGSSKAITLL